MNARKTFALSLLVLFTTVTAASAAPGTNKARGEYNRGGWESGGSARARSSYSYRAPATYQAPIVESAEVPQVAQTPAEGRRFSYEPSDTVASGTPCPQANAQAPAVDSDRRYSYAPTTQATVAPSVSSPSTYYSRPSYSTGNRSAGNVDLWALPKTDPRKFNSR
ncbi:MAG: hypothetical protein H0T51_11000 [Pirellulales bacterium]|nr:hypothetical protein [Pirellulales bacterium]